MTRRCDLSLEMKAVPLRLVLRSPLPWRHTPSHLHQRHALVPTPRRPSHIPLPMYLWRTLLLQRGLVSELPQ